MVRFVALLLAASVMAGPPAQAASPHWSCYGRFAGVLRKRDFPGADCARAFVKIQFLGTVRQGNDKYLIYEYSYADDPKRISGVEPHALKRILIFKNKTSVYLGNYAMDAGFAAKVESNRIRVLTETPDLDGTIEIGPAGPPKEVFYGGDAATFDR